MTEVCCFFFKFSIINLDTTDKTESIPRSVAVFFISGFWVLHKNECCPELFAQVEVQIVFHTTVY